MKYFLSFYVTYFLVRSSSKTKISLKMMDLGSQNRSWKTMFLSLASRVLILVLRDRSRSKERATAVFIWYFSSFYTSYFFRKHKTTMIFKWFSFKISRDHVKTLFFLFFWKNMKCRNWKIIILGPQSHALSI